MGLNILPICEVDKAEISESDEGSVFEFELEKGKQEIEVVIGRTGKVMNKAVKNDDDKD